MNRSIICIVFFILITSHCFNGMDNYLYINNVKLKQLQDKMKKQKGGATKELNKEYDVFGSNCAQTVQSALIAAGKADGSKVSLIDRIVNIITGVELSMHDKAPNAIYKRIKEQNEETVIKTK